MTQKKSFSRVLAEIMSEVPTSEHDLYHALRELKANVSPQGDDIRWKAEQILREHAGDPSRDLWRQKIWDIFNAE